MVGLLLHLGEVLPPFFLGHLGDSLLGKFHLTSVKAHCFLDLLAPFIEAILSSSKESRQLVVFHLSGVIERMIVTLGATDLLAQEHLDGVADVVE